MLRRKFIQLSSMGVAAMPVNYPFKRNHHGGKGLTGPPDVMVVGAGTFGVWTAYHLNRMGAKVTLLDAYGPGNSRASSGGETRLIQVDHDNPVYVQSAIRAYDWWKQIEESSGERIVLSTGRLAMSQQDSYRQYALNRQSQLTTLGVTNTEVLEQDEVRYRWPQIFTDDLASAMYHDGGASGSTLLARKGVRVVAQQFVQNGGNLMIAHGIPVVGPDGKISGVDIKQKHMLRAQWYVFACGPWLPKLFPKLLAPKLKVERRDVLFIGTAAGDDRFSYPNLPEWSVQDSGYYGFPSIEGRGLKVAPYPDYNAFNPDADERLVNHYQVKRAHDFVKHRFPALRHQPVIESRVCQVTNSIDSNFVVDLPPTVNNTMIIGAGSGHGFKHGPAIGEYAANRILDRVKDQQLDQLFAIKDELFSNKP